jgi:GTPase involved in cell partitioning and DNA repair
MGAKKDPRIAIVVELMLQTRTERTRRLIEVRDMRRKEGRVSIAQEAEAIIAALDKYDASVWDAMLAITDEERDAIAKAEG